MDLPTDLILDSIHGYCLGFFFSFGMVFYNCFWVWLISYNSIATYLVFQYETQHKSWGKMFSEEELAFRIQKFTIVLNIFILCLNHF